MSVVPLGLKAYKRTDAFTPETQFLNLYLEKDESGVSPDNWLRIQRPGLELRATLAGIPRGATYYAPLGQHLFVSGGNLYANFNNVGSISGASNVAMTTTAFYAAILSEGVLYLYNGSLVTVAVPDIDGVAQVPVDVDQLNGYILVLCASGSFFYLEPGSSTIDPLAFYTAESSPDGGVALRRLQDEFAISGGDSTEFWQATGDGEDPFQRVTGRTYERGCASRDSMRRFDNALVWHADDGNVYRGGGAVPQIISDPGIAERLRVRSGNTSAWTFSTNGHKWYALRIPGQGTFCFDAATSTWSKWGSVGLDTWNPHVGVEANQVVLAGSSIDGRIFELRAEYQNDDGVDQLRLVTGTVGVNGKPGRNDSFTVAVGASADCTVNLRWRDGQDDYPAYAEELEVRAPYDLATCYRLGQPDQPFRTFEVSITDPVRCQISGAVANQAWQ